MTQEEKQLLFKDLCARFPYGTKFPYHINGDSNHKECDCVATIDDISDDVVGFTYEEYGVTRDWSCPISEVKPYLRPMSSMIEEEDKKWQIYKNNIAESCDARLEERISELHDWFNCHHFDFHHLIEKGLALEAPEGMYKQ